jgi:hypothetical protein
VSHLNGSQEVPPRDTHAQGQAIFHLSPSGTSLQYKLIGSNIENAPIVVWLYPSTDPVQGPFGSGRHDGVLAQGTIAADDFVGPLAGHPMSDLVAALNNGNAYVNIHTNDNVDGVNTGPGDFPGGEIRADVR